MCRHLETMPVEAGQKRSTLIPRLPCETRFGSSVIMMRDVLRCLPAITQTVVEDMFMENYADNEKVQELRSLILDMDVIQRIKDTVQALDPICDTIYTLEADK
jgi:hypothetical protein